MKVKGKLKCSGYGPLVLNPTLGVDLWVQCSYILLCSSYRTFLSFIAEGEKSVMCFLAKVTTDMSSTK